MVTKEQEESSSTVQYCIVQYSIVQYSINLKYFSVRWENGNEGVGTTVQYSTHSTVQYSGKMVTDAQTFRNIVTYSLMDSTILRLGLADG